MFNENKYFILPTNSEIQTIWRYMDFWKFKDLIESETLFIPKIRQMGDQTEGRIVDDVRNVYVDDLKRNGYEHIANTMDSFANREDMLDSRVSSWNIAKNESFMFWKSYTSGRSAVAIKSSVKKLIESLVDNPFWQHIGKVHYYSDHTDYVWDWNLYHLILNKSDTYIGENELRICNVIPASEKEKNPALKELEDVRVRLDLETLIDSIHLAPNATDEEFDAVQQLLISKGLSKKVVRSKIDDKWSNA